MEPSKPLLADKKFASTLYWRFVRLTVEDGWRPPSEAEHIAGRLCGPPIWLWVTPFSDRPLGIGKQLPWTVRELEAHDRALKYVKPRQNQMPEYPDEWEDKCAVPDFDEASRKLVPTRLLSEQGQTRLKHLMETRMNKSTVSIRVDRKDMEGLQKYKPWKGGFAVSAT